MSFRMTAVALSVVLACATLLGACSEDETAPIATPSPSVTPSPAEALAALARSGQDASYTATYALRGTKPPSSGTVVIRRTPDAYRLDVTTKGSTAILVRNRTGTYSCQKEPKQKTRCFKVAAADKPIPRLFDAGLQKVFDDYLDAFAANAVAYDVEADTGTPADGSVPAGTCFAVRPSADEEVPAVAAGTYCLSDDGVPTKAEFASGNLDLRRLAAAPEGRVTPPAKATPLPKN